jgi:hypothetical protein
MHESAESVVSQQEPIELLEDQVGSLASQDNLTAPEMRLELVESGLDLPALMVETGKVLC